MSHCDILHIAMTSANRPDWVPELRARLAGVDAAPARIDDIVLELEQHLEDRYDELIEDGRDADAARAAALASPHARDSPASRSASPARRGSRST